MITYNHGDFLINAIEGVLNQITDFDFELIICDDCSSDDTPAVVSSFIENHIKGSSILYKRNVVNLGMSRNFYWALSQCNGEFIAICDGDDYWIDSYKLQKQVDFLTNHRNFSFSFHRTHLFDQVSGEISPDLNQSHFLSQEYFIPISGYTISNGWQIGMQTLMFRRNFILNLRIENFTFFRDVHLLSHLLQFSPGVCLNFFGSVYRIHGGGEYSKLSDLQKIVIGYQCFDELFCVYKSNFLKLSRANYLHEIIQFHIEESSFKAVFHYLFKLMAVNWNLKVLLFYLRAIINRIFRNENRVFD